MSTPAGTDPFGQPYETPPPPLKVLDTTGWFIATLHGILGHDKTAAFLGQDPGDKRDCLVCAYESHPDDGRRRAVTGALGVTRRLR